ncbi:hypothetical protein H8356DRAFT_1344531 [Neocallimastix lanati (nom. inval.)]|nr:hypothetical protein H8356DRAFT_1344531 [Neocallimastix sp. JGI-2020a]
MNFGRKIYSLGKCFPKISSREWDSLTGSRKWDSLTGVKVQRYYIRLYNGYLMIPSKLHGVGIKVLSFNNYPLDWYVSIQYNVKGNITQCIYYKASLNEQATNVLMVDDISIKLAITKILVIL